ncbi:MAG: hypothetical protein IBX72_12885 [Nitrospirae bacterium]|jgi:hypothetical protein|nr:hypothetical protein [Nitrospirota bacterium]
MNKYQKIALLIGLIILILVFGKTITRVSFGVMGLLGKGLIIVAATVYIIYSLKKASKKK